MNVQAIINVAADEADEFLRGTGSPTEARPAIADWIREHHPELTPPDRKRVVEGLLALLAEEGFFNGGDTADAWSESSGSGEKPA